MLKELVMEIKIIRTEIDYEDACRRIYELIHASEDPIEPGTAEGDEFDLLTLLVEKYEQENYPIQPPDPIDAVLFRMEQMDLKQKDIAPLFGGKTRVSEVLNRKRPLSLKMIILLNRYLGVPFESLVSGNKSVELLPLEKMEIIKVPSIKEYLISHPGSRLS